MSTDLFTLAQDATRHIVEKNLQLFTFSGHVVLVYDRESPLARYISQGYQEALIAHPDSEIIEYNEEQKSLLKEKLLSLQSGDMVILVQSTNFRLEDFRIRISLQKIGVGCLEHNHLQYIRPEEEKTYLRAISYQTLYFEHISEHLKKRFDVGNHFQVVSSNGDTLEGFGGYEDMKQNTGAYTKENRYGTLPMGENFTEIKDFSQLNGKLWIQAYPGFDYVVRQCEPFMIRIEKSMIVEVQNGPADFMEVYEKILRDEGEVMIRELGFGLNPAIDFDHPLNDVNAFERMEGFHISIGKKHNIYRKKLSKNVVQRYHIDIFPQVSEMYFDGEKIFSQNKFVF